MHDTLYSNLSGILPRVISMQHLRTTGQFMHFYCNPLLFTREFKIDVEVSVVVSFSILVHFSPRAIAELYNRDTIIILNVVTEKWHKILYTQA